MRTLAFALLCLTACDDRAEVLAMPGAIRWAQDDCRFEVSGRPDMWGRAALDGDSLRLTIGGFPPGMTLRVEDTAAEVDERGDASVTADVAAAIGRLPIDGDRPPLEGVRVTLASSGDDPIEVPLSPCLTAGQPMRLLWNATREPVLFEGEREERGPIRTIVARVSPDTPGYDIGATARVARDVDAIAVIERRTARSRRCEGYRDQNGRASSVTLQLKDATVTVYARRTGRVLATRRFDPVDECPGSVLSTGYTNEVDSPMPEITPWLESLLTR